HPALLYNLHNTSHQMLVGTHTARNPIHDNSYTVSHILFYINFDSSFLRFYLKTHFDLPTITCRRKFPLRYIRGILLLLPTPASSEWGYSLRPSVRGRLGSRQSGSSNRKCGMQTDYRCGRTA